MDFNVIKPKNANELNNLIKSNYFNIVFGGNNDINRITLENKKVNMLIDAEPEENDFMHSRNSGLNQVLVKLAKQNNISIGFSFNKILNDNKRVDLFGKIMQNVMLCNKYKVKMYIVNFVKDDLDERNKNDLKDLGMALGMLPGKFDILEIKR